MPSYLEEVPRSHPKAPWRVSETRPGLEAGALLLETFRLWSCIGINGKHDEFLIQERKTQRFLQLLAEISPFLFLFFLLQLKIGR
jgi:hypothetical protein